MQMIPGKIYDILERFEQAGFEAYIVGGCVRDLLLGIKAKDWDITTSAKPEDIQELFPNSVYENTFGTVAIKTGLEEQSLKIVEVTTFRTEAKYSDKRHPDKVIFSTSLEEDLARRDFTVNAIALHRVNKKKEIIDPFNGQEDLKKRLIRAVGKAEDRFNEDALRMMRAIRFATTFDFIIEEKTLDAITKHAPSIKMIARERIRDEFLKMIESPNSHKGILLLKDTGLLKLVLPELHAGVGVGQNKHHIYTVFEHNLLALKWADEHKYPLHVKVAALFHDVGKPQTKRGEGESSTFYGHEVVGARITAQTLDRLHFPKALANKIVPLIRFHLFYYDVGEVTERSVRRLVAKVGPQNMDDLVKVRICDRMGSGVPKPEPYRLRHFQFMVEKVQKDPLSVGMLKVGGADIMKTLDIKPGPLVGQILNILLDEVLDDPKKNNKKYLSEKMKELAMLSPKKLVELEKEALQKQGKLEEEAQGDIKKKYWVK